MLTRKCILTSAAAVMLAFSASAYAKYYQVTDTATGAMYYTKSIDREKCGAIEFKDYRTHAKVTLQNSSVLKLTKSEWRQDVGR